MSKHKMRGMMKGSLGFLMLATLALMPTAWAESGTAHQQDYLAALEKVMQAEARIAQEMERVQLGTVGHYDFLQYEHIELVRHARALAYPPSGLTAESRAAIKTQTEQLLTSANELEWVIADFLRAFAQVRSAGSNTLDIAATMKRDSSAELATRIEALETGMLLYMVSGYAEGWDALSVAFDGVLEAANEVQRRELAVQKHLLEENSPRLGAQRQKLIDSDVDTLALQLQALYATGA
ncbi:MAG: hypothetical protein Q8L20_04125 [Gammaproteobacteria bacterium]|nr:hypothetical protein [Gammaproteobacteria bacterium]